MNQTPEWWLSAVMDFLPVIPLAIAWTQVARRDQGVTRTNASSLIAATASVLWIGAGLFLPDFLGATSDSVRWLATNGNFIVMTIAAGMAVGKMHSGRVATAVGCFMLAFAWSHL